MGAPESTGVIGQSYDNLKLFEILMSWDDRTAAGHASRSLLTSAEGRWYLIRYALLHGNRNASDRGRWSSARTMPGDGRLW